MRFNYNNVMRRALIAFGMMFGLLFAAATSIVWYMGLPLKAGLMTAVFAVLLQYIIGPYIVSIIYKIEFDSYVLKNLMKPEIADFISKVCSDNNMPVPKLGFINDGNPNAFVYGHFKQDARLVVTKGLLDILNEEEQKSVIAHELGHIKNNDFILMTIVSLIPLIMYQIYAWTHSNKDNIVYLVALGAYAAYIVSQYFVLSFSRIREFYADNFSKIIIGTGEPLKSALVKIAYGFTKNGQGKKLRASTIGISNAAQSESFLLLNYNNRNNDSESYKKLMAWDTKNLWGKWYEINSTHPLTAKRILALSEDNISVNKPGIKQYIHFLLELFLKILPWVTLAYIVIPNAKDFRLFNIFKSTWRTVQTKPIYLVVLGVTTLLCYYYSYGRNFGSKSIEELLLREDASPVKGIPAILEGKVIGKGIPGLFWSEDIVLDDGTGIILVDYRQPFKFLEFLFGFLIVDNITEKDAKVIGWYKRSNKPYFVCRHIIVEGKKYVSYVYILTKILGYALIITGLVLYVLKLLR